MNQFSSLSWGSFQMFSKLYELDLTANEVGQVMASAAPLLPGLRVLRLGHNRLTSLADRAFSACPALINLHLDNNAIESLSDDTFAGLSKLEILDLTSNHIRVLPPRLLRPLIAIETLYLETNQISELPDDWFNPREDVPYLYLSANPWTCDCSLTYLRTYLEDFYFNFYVRDGKIISRDHKSLVCHSPQQSKGQAVFDVALDYLCTTPTPPQIPTSLLPPSFTSSVTEGPEWESEGVRGDGLIAKQPAPPTTSSVSFPDHSSTTTTVLTTLAPQPPTVTPSRPTTESLPTTSTATLPATLPAVTPTDSEVPWTWRWGKNEGGATPLRHTPGAGVFCVWLFAGNVCLCALGAASSLMILVRLVVLYRGAYKPLSAALATEGGAQQVRLYGGTTSVYRSVLFVNREEGEMVQGGPVYRTTLHRAPGTQVALQQWSDVMGERQDGTGWRQRFSVLLRQEREWPGGREERDWVVGAWLAQQLPGVTPEWWPAH
ncbi:uncharacterized protein gp1ba [Festucalex cinctus]